MTDPAGRAGNGPPADPAGAVFAALADPTRRQVLAMVAGEGPLTATELAAVLPISRQGVAKHLAVLDRAGLVVAERSGRETRYTARPDRLDDARAWLDTVGSRWDRRLAALKARLEGS